MNDEKDWIHPNSAECTNWRKKVDLDLDQLIDMPISCAGPSWWEAFGPRGCMRICKVPQRLRVNAYETMIKEVPIYADYKMPPCVMDVYKMGPHRYYRTGAPQEILTNEYFANEALQIANNNIEETENKLQHFRLKVYQTERELAFEKILLKK